MKLLNLQEIFNEKFFRVPDYQRGYSWGKQQCEDLWQDIEILVDKKDHYTGVLSVVQRESAPENCAPEDFAIPENSKVSIVDGQQRITTLIILINAILNSDSVKGQERINGKKTANYAEKYLSDKRGEQEGITVPVFGYDKDNPSHAHFKKEILGLKEMDSGVPACTLYTLNLDAAHEFFASKVKDLSFDEAGNLLRKVTEHLKFNYYEIDNELNEFVAFETMNNRGKPLSDLELLKNRLIYLSTLLPNGDKEKIMLRRNINEAWKTIYEYLGKGEKPLDDDEFLKDHWIMYFGYGGRSSSKVYREFLLSNHFTAVAIHNRNNPLELSDIEKYAHDIQCAAKEYFFLHNPYHSDCECSGNVKHWLAKLNRLGYVSFKPLIMSMLIHQADLDDSVMVDILKAAERFYFVAILVRRYQTNKKNNHIYRCSTEFHKNPRAWTLDKVRTELSLGALDISNKVSRESFCEEVRDYSEEDFYQWRGLRYFLYEYEVRLQEEERGEAKLKWEDINAETIEHIYPQTPVSGWGKFFSKKADKDLLHDLGNLLLLSQSKNSTIGNGLFVEKSEVFSTNSYSAIKISKDYKEWTPETVNERREKLLDFLWKRWELEEPNA